ncbi:TetR/AcrR family transcriptional regulator [Achromobacter aloeverae]|uniref:TetR family transcriptional regulator n=1 Tax=Achromobacter aloeverae TaxID=1750518 RepID=A0A4Q1HLY6_9BURK|nr:TetR/AcrR family transcriptional regulator [Achromobacter aloeverae]RXN91503.1 TetR family transcriptional regulator [Achromobacter aloeverae]
MRKSREETARTRARIVAAAAEEFRRGGIAATGLASLMSAAGLTHGGFYKHFASKDQLVAEACASIMIDVTDTLAERALREPPDQRLAWFVHAYLSPRHRDDPAHGCGLAALGTELARSSAETRDVVTDGLSHLVEAIARLFDPPGGAHGRARAQTLAAGLVGAITLARAVNDPALSDELLANTASTLLASIR